MTLLRGAKMNAMHFLQVQGKARGLLAVVLLASLVAILPVVACDEEEEEEARTPTGTPTAAATGTPAATPTSGEDVPGVTDTEIVIGQHQTLSGTLGAIYSMLPRSQAAYFDYINDTQGGVCGREIVFKVADDKGVPDGALEATRKLAEEDKVFAFVGNGGGAQHATAWDYLNQQGIPDLLVAGGILRYYDDPEGYPWTTSALPDYAAEGRFFGEHISLNFPDKKVGVLLENGDFGWDGLAGLKEGLDLESNPIVAEETYEVTDIDVRSQVMRIEDAGTEVLVLYTGLGQTGQAVKAAERLGFVPAQVYASYINSDHLLFQIVSPPLVENLITFQCYQLAPWTDVPAVAQHYEIMRNYGGPDPGNFTIFSQVLAETAVEVLSRACDNLTREGLMDAMESLDGWSSDLLVEGVTFNTSDTDHLTLEAGRMLRVVVDERGKGDFEYFGPLFVIEGGEVVIIEQ
jgi:branched-chain amino acid transport system substrate-binding protein